MSASIGNIVQVQFRQQNKSAISRLTMDQAANLGRISLKVQRGELLEVLDYSFLNGLGFKEVLEPNLPRVIELFLQAATLIQRPAVTPVNGRGVERLFAVLRCPGQD